MDTLATPDAWEQPGLDLEEDDPLAAGLSTPLAVPDPGDAKTYDKGEWATPQWLFDRYDEIHGFTLDTAANAVNAKCPRFCVTPQESLRLLAEHGAAIQRPDGSLALPDGRMALVDGLAQSWAGETVWVNPPYSPKGAVVPWLEKAHAEAQRGATVVMLLLADTSTNWYHDLVVPLASEYELLRGRVTFVHPVTGEEGSAPKFGSLVAVFRPPSAPAPMPVPLAALAPPPDLADRLRRWARHIPPFLTNDTAKRLVLQLLPEETPGGAAP